MTMLASFFAFEFDDLVVHFISRRTVNSMKLDVFQC